MAAWFDGFELDGLAVDFVIAPSELWPADPLADALNRELDVIYQERPGLIVFWSVGVRYPVDPGSSTASV